MRRRLRERGWLERGSRLERDRRGQLAGRSRLVGDRRRGLPHSRDRSDRGRRRHPDPVAARRTARRRKFERSLSRRGRLRPLTVSHRAAGASPASSRDLAREVDRLDESSPWSTLTGEGVSWLPGSGRTDGHIGGRRRLRKCIDRWFIDCRGACAVGCQAGRSGPRSLDRQWGGTSYRSGIWHCRVGFVTGTAAASRDAGPACTGADEMPLGTGSSDTASVEGAGAAA